MKLKGKNPSWDRITEITHELRTPVAAILVATEILENETSGKMDPSVVKYIDLIRRNAKHLMKMIEDHLERGACSDTDFSPNPAELELRPFVQSIISEISPLFDKKHLSVDLKISEDAPASLITDEDFLYHILLNLLSNACKYTSEGGAHLELSRQGDMVCFTVSDSGIGIPSRDRSAIFEEFQRAEIEPEHQGRGIGLAIALRLAKLLNGSLECNSKLGSGSVFNLCLPIVSS